MSSFYSAAEVPVTIHRKLIAIALILLMQGPALLLQEVAWVKMLISYSQERGLKRGVLETFDGEHPCELCHQAAKIREHEKTQDSEKKQAPEQRHRFAWAEMMINDRWRMPVMVGYDISVPVIAATDDDTGRGADAPDAPPPKWS